MSSKRPCFDFEKTYAHLDEQGGALAFAGDAAFWEELMTSKARSPGAKRCMNGGWLVSAYCFSEDWSVWEMHPAGEESLVALSGTMDIWLEIKGRKRKVKLKTGQTCIVPRGAWHTAKVPKSCTMLALTYGRGTKHRPV